MLGHNRKRMTGAECLADMLAGYGVTHVFMVPAVLRRTFAEMERRTSIKRIHTHGEKSAAYMADGYARASGKPGVCMAQVIGALNLAAGLRDAWLAHSPVIAFTGGRDPATKFRKVYQEIDDVPTFEPVTKFNATVDDVSRFPDMVRQAFRVAVSGTPGPVHLQFRGNEGQVDQEEAELEPLVEDLFACVPPFRPAPDDASVGAALAVLQKAERPVIVAGGGVRASGAARELVALAETLQIPVATSLNGKDTIPGTHPLAVGVVGTYSRESANRVVGQADLVCFIGSETGGMTTHFWAVPKIGTPAIQIDIDPEALGRNYPLQAAVQRRREGDACAHGGTGRPRSGGSTQAWIAQAQSSARSGTRNMTSLLHVRCKCRSIRRACAAISPGTLPDDAIVIVDTGHAGMWMGGMYDLRSADAELLPLRRPSRLGVLRRHRREGRVPRAAGRRVHRRCGLLVSHRRDRDRGALEAQQRDGRQQQRRRQSVQARLRPRLRRHADRAGARTVDLHPGQLRHASPRTWARWASAWKSRPISRRRSQQALAANRPVVIDVVTDIDALAPPAVS